MWKFLSIVLLFSLTAPLLSQDSLIYLYHRSKPADIRRLESYSIVYLTGFSITVRGKVVCNLPLWAAGFLHKKHSCRIDPVISFSSPSAGIAILTGKDKRKGSLDSLARLVQRNNFSGIHLDIENIPSRLNRELASYLGEIQSRLPGITISMALLPQIDFTHKDSKLHNYRLLAPYLDYVVLMAYDWHSSRTAPGCVTSLSWAEKNIQYALNYFKPKQLILGIPAYGYIWKENGKITSISMKYGEALLKGRSHEDNEGCIHFIGINNGRRYSIYVPTGRMVDRLVNLARKYKLPGTAIWRAGFLP
jgi:spore germination protein YaaH